MNSDFRVSISFFRHPKTKNLKRTVGPEGVICLLDLWRFAAEFYPSGHFPGGMTGEDIESEVGWSGTPNALITALEGNGFLERSGGGAGGSHLRIHDWRQHNGWAAAAPERSEKARLAATSRHARSTSQADAGSIVRAHAPSPSPVPSPSPLPPPTTLRSDHPAVPHDPPTRKKRAPAAPPPEPPEPSIRPEIDWAFQAWTEANGGTKPTWRKADYVTLTEAIRHCGDSFRQRWTHYLADHDNFVRGHTPRKFASEPDRWLQPPTNGKRQERDYAPGPEAGTKYRGKGGKVWRVGE